MKRVIFGALIISLSLLLQACNTTDPPPPDGEKATLELKLEDVSCIEAWIELTTTNLPLPTTVTLNQTNPTGDTKSQILNLNTQDSLLYIDSLLPNQTYKFHTTIQSYNQAEVKSNELSVTTMDTTSHNFTFETFTFGGTAGSSVLYDVAIINENNIWAVGEIYVADTSQNGYTMYNAVHWDGNQWELKRILYDGNIWTIKTIFAFNQNDIWFSAFVRYDGQKFIELPISPILTGWSINKIWGSSSRNLYVVGNNGNIVFYNGTSWSRIESGTELNINDIWGDYNQKTGEWEILAVASNKFFNEGKKIFKIDGLLVTEINVVGLTWSLSSIWFNAARKYFIAGDGIYYKKTLNESWVKDLTFIQIYKDRIRGTQLNNILVSGSNGLISHFNGVNWKHYINNELPYYSGRLLSCDVKDNILIAVGWKEIQAIITMGKK
ncbi:MAG: glucosyl transferase [Ignavibacteriota bacterium]|nr:MAG: glucosyl transferase [Ignavibacteriota bacterium]